MATLSPALVHQYLARVRQPGDAPPPPTLCTLARLHWAHLQAVPFENLSLKLAAARAQHDIDVDLRPTFDKIVGSGRGGYCFEQNGLFGAVLRSLGFDVMDMAARVVQGGPEEPEEVEEAPRLDGTDASQDGINRVRPELRLSGHDHHILLVTLPSAGTDGDQPPRLFLADCGFGGESLPLPLLLPDSAPRYVVPQQDACATEPYGGQDWAEGLPVPRVARYRVRLGLPGVRAAPDPQTTPHFAQRAGYYLQHQSPRGAWKDLYFFRLDEFLPQDFAMQNHYIKHNPASHFVANLVCARQTPEGRVTILNDSFRVWRDGDEAPAEDTTIEGEEQLLAILDTHFGIRL